MNRRKRLLRFAKRRGIIKKRFCIYRFVDHAVQYFSRIAEIIRITEEHLGKLLSYDSGGNEEIVSLEGQRQIFQEGGIISGRPNDDVPILISPGEWHPGCQKVIDELQELIK